MAEFKASEGRRDNDEIALKAQTYLEWIQEQKSEGLFALSEVRCGKKGKVEIIELDPAYKEALCFILNNDGNLDAALSPVILELKRVFSVEHSGCALLRNGTWQLIEAVGTAVMLPGERVVRRRHETAELLPLGTESLDPAHLVDAVAVSCEIPALRGGVLRLCTAETLWRSLSSKTRMTLTEALPYNPAGSAALFELSETGRTKLRYSQTIRAAVEWADHVTEAQVAAIAELQDRATLTDCLELPLRLDDIMLLDTGRWLYGRSEADVDDRLCWFNGMWRPKLALPPTEESLSSNPLWHAMAFRRRPNDEAATSSEAAISDEDWIKKLAETL